MNIKSTFFLVTLFICAITDIVTFRIKNIILVFSAASLLIMDLFIYADESPVSDLTDGTIVILILIPFYMLGLLGAGDVKLLALTAMYTGLLTMCRIAAASIVVSLIIISVIYLVRHENITKIKYPFAFALLMGALPFWFDRF